MFPPTIPGYQKHNFMTLGKQRASIQETCSHKPNKKNIETAQEARETVFQQCIALQAASLVQDILTI